MGQHQPPAGVSNGDPQLPTCTTPGRGRPCRGTTSAHVRPSSELVRLVVSPSPRHSARSAADRPWNSAIPLLRRRGPVNGTAWNVLRSALSATAATTCLCTRVGGPVADAAVERGCGGPKRRPPCRGSRSNWSATAPAGQVGAVGETHVKLAAASFCEYGPRRFRHRCVRVAGMQGGQPASRSCWPTVRAGSTATSPRSRCRGRRVPGRARNSRRSHPSGSRSAVRTVPSLGMPVCLLPGPISPVAKPIGTAWPSPIPRRLSATATGPVPVVLSRMRHERRIAQRGRLDGVLVREVRARNRRRSGLSTSASTIGGS